MDYLSLLQNKIICLLLYQYGWTGHRYPPNVSVGAESPSDHTTTGRSIKNDTTAPCSQNDGSRRRLGVSTWNFHHIQQESHGKILIQKFFKI